MNFTQIDVINPNSLRLFALFSGYNKKNFSSNSVLHLFVELQNKNADIQKATVSHIPFDEINMTISKAISSRTQKQALFAYILIAFALMSGMWFLLGNIGIALSLVLFEPNIQKKMFHFLSNHLLAYYKKSFYKYLKSRI